MKKNTNPILIFRQVSLETNKFVRYHYNIAGGFHTAISPADIEKSSNNYYSNTMITKTREAADTVEYSE